MLDIEGSVAVLVAALKSALQRLDSLEARAIVATRGADDPDTVKPNPSSTEPFNLIVRDNNAEPDGYALKQNLSYELTAQASGIYFGNVLNSAVGGSQTANAQVWANLDRMFVTTESDAAGAVVPRYVQAVRYRPARNLVMWSVVAEARDMTGLPSSEGGPMLGLEVDIAANGLDDAGTRQGVVITLLDGSYGNGGHPAAQRALGVFNGGMSDAYYHSVLDIATPFRDAVLDTRHAGDAKGGSGNAIWMRDGQAIAFDAAGMMRMRWDTSVNKLVVSWNGKPIWSVDPSGNTWQSGTKG